MKITDYMTYTIFKFPKGYLFTFSDFPAEVSQNCLGAIFECTIIAIDIPFQSPYQIVHKQNYLYSSHDPQVVLL